MAAWPVDLRLDGRDKWVSRTTNTISLLAQGTTIGTWNVLTLLLSEKIWMHMTMLGLLGAIDNWSDGKSVSVSSTLKSIRRLKQSRDTWWWWWWCFLDKIYTKQPPFILLPEMPASIWVDILREVFFFFAFVRSWFQIIRKYWWRCALTVVLKRPKRLF